MVRVDPGLLGDGEEGGIDEGELKRADWRGEEEEERLVPSFFFVLS